MAAEYLSIGLSEVSLPEWHLRKCVLFIAGSGVLHSRSSIRPPGLQRPLRVSARRTSVIGLPGAV